MRLLLIGAVLLLAAGCRDQDRKTGGEPSSTPTLTAESQDAIQAFQEVRAASQDLSSYHGELAGEITIRGVTVNISGARDVALPDRMHATTNTGGASVEIVTRRGRIYARDPRSNAFIDTGLSTAADFFPLNPIILSQARNLHLIRERSPASGEDVYVLTFALRGRHVLQAAAQLFGSSRSLEAAIGQEDPAGDAECRLVVRAADYRLIRFDLNADMRLAEQPFSLHIAEEYSRFDEPVSVPDVPLPPG